MSEIARIGYVEEDKRWKATVTYRVTEAEDRVIIYHVEELGELEALVEMGPTWCAIKDFRIEYNGPKETIKQSFEQ